MELSVNIGLDRGKEKSQKVPEIGFNHRLPRVVVVGLLRFIDRSLSQGFLFRHHIEKEALGDRRCLNLELPPNPLRQLPSKGRSAIMILIPPCEHPHLWLALRSPIWFPSPY
jgi:hypothetical protein